MESINFYDTNCLLHNELESFEGVIYLSSITLQEIENIKVSDKKDGEVKYNARKATRWLRDNEEKYVCIPVRHEHYKLLDKLKMPIDNDNLIIACAKLLEKEFDVTFYTEDLCCYNIAKTFGIKCSSSKVTDVIEYKGFKEFAGNTSQINSLFNQYMNNCFNQLDLVLNEYLIITNTDTGDTDEYKYKEDNLEPLVLPNSKIIKGMNSQQRCAIDLLHNDDIPIKVICGEFGSGKTYLSTRIAVNKVTREQKYDKVMFVRNPIGSGEEIGFLPGTKEEKTCEYYNSIIDQLDGGEQELERMRMSCQIETQVPYFMKGRSLPNTFILVDESEDLDSKTFKLIGSRLAKNSVIVFSGDMKQAEKKYKGDNGLRSFIEYAKGNPLVGIVCMDGNVRSEASSVFIDFN